MNHIKIAVRTTEDDMNSDHDFRYGNFYYPVSREEWEASLEQYIKDGLAMPGETYEQYLAILLHYTYGKPPKTVM